MNDMQDIFSRYLDSYINIESRYLNERARVVLTKYYESQGHQRKNISGRIFFLCTSNFLEFFGPQMASPIGSMPFHRAQKTFEFQGPTPSHLP
jgi:hypothetical protein